MDLKMCLILIMTVSLCRGIVVENYEKNISCKDIKTNAGFMFPHNGSAGSEIFVTCNKTLIAYAQLGKQSFESVNEVMSIDNYSVIMRDCRDLEIKSIIPDGKFVKEICINYKITQKVKNPDPTDSPAPWGLIIGATCGVALIGLIGLSWYFCRKKMKKQHSAVPVCDEPVNDQAEMETMLSETPSSTGPLGSGEKDTEQDNTLESVYVDSIDPMADGKTPQSLSLDHNFNNEGIQPSENGDPSAPNNNRASVYQAMHRNLRDDPGGMDGIRKTHNGCTPGVRTPEDPENEGQPQRAAIQAFDMKGEAADLVNKHDFDQQVNRCPTALEADVKSTLNMKDHTHI